MTPHLLQRLSPVLGLDCHRIVVLHLRQTHFGKDEGDDEHHNAQYDVGQSHISQAVATVLEEKLPHCESSKQAAHSIERLREIQTTRGRLACSQLCHIRISSCLQEGQSAANDKECEEEGIESGGLGGWHEEQRANTEEDKSEHHAPAIAKAIDEETGGDSHQEIAHVGGDLNERRLCDRDVQLVLEMFVEHIENSTGKSPEKEECGYEYERHQIVGAVRAE